jgi:hypothetical protein
VTHKLNGHGGVEKEGKIHEVYDRLLRAYWPNHVGMNMAAPRMKRQEEEGQQLPTFSLQIPQRTTQQPESSVVKIPNGYEFMLGGTKLRITSEVTPTSQMLYLSIDLNALSAPARPEPRRSR